MLNKKWRRMKAKWNPITKFSEEKKLNKWHSQTKRITCDNIVTIRDPTSSLIIYYTKRNQTKWYWHYKFTLNFKALVICVLYHMCFSTYTLAFNVEH